MKAGWRTRMFDHVMVALEVFHRILRRLSVEASLGGMSGNISFIYVLEIVTF